VRNGPAKREALRGEGGYRIPERVPRRGDAPDQERKAEGGQVPQDGGQGAQLHLADSGMGDSQIPVRFFSILLKRARGKQSILFRSFLARGESSPGKPLSPFIRCANKVDLPATFFSKRASPIAKRSILLFLGIHCVGTDSHCSAKRFNLFHPIG